MPHLQGTETSDAEPVAGLEVLDHETDHVGHDHLGLALRHRMHLGQLGGELLQGPARGVMGPARLGQRGSTRGYPVVVFDGLRADIALDEGLQPAPWAVSLGGKPTGALERRAGAGI